ncbi:Tn3 family transposase [Nonomuraea insulae]|uniref:Tn3 family transposase n=1 Tax=Nonomuraea insulae TaxID=1616787 RepID=A0ABW1CPE7_9ACTN
MTAVSKQGCQRGDGVLEPLARNRVNLKKIETWWPGMLRVAGSLVTNQVRAYDLLRMFGRESHPTPLGQAFAEYGRIAKTEHLMRMVDPVDDTYRWQMNRQPAGGALRPLRDPDAAGLDDDDAEN